MEAASRPGCFTPRKRTPAPIQYAADGTQSRSGRFWAEKNVLPPPGFYTRLVHSVTYLQHRLHCLSFFVAIISVEMCEADFYINYIFQYFFLCTSHVLLQELLYHILPQ
jgi:hypothetical protein